MSNTNVCVCSESEGKLIHSMVAHLDSVTSLAVDPNGLYLMSGSTFSPAHGLTRWFLRRCVYVSGQIVCQSHEFSWMRHSRRLFNGVPVAASCVSHCGAGADLEICTWGGKVMA